MHSTSQSCVRVRDGSVWAPGPERAVAPMTQDTCSICTDDIEENQGVILDCTHKFHAKCAIQWFRYHNDTCPNCRSDYSQLVPWAKTPAQRIASMRRQQDKMPPWVRRQLKLLDRLRCKNRELATTARRIRKDNIDVFRTLRKLMRRQLQTQQQEADARERLSNYAAPRVPFLSANGLPSDAGDYDDANNFAEYVGQGNTDADI